jgi:glycosyltransferase involved in cell wall biosynthesis
MRILIANKFWYLRGGLERVMFDEVEWLESAGHAVAHFSTTHPDNDPSPWADYFVPYLELGQGAPLTVSEKAIAAARMFYSVEAKRRFRRLLAAFRPDVIHVHGIHRQISPSILGAAREADVPVVQTLHDCHHVCPANVLLLPDGEPCEPRQCGELWYGPCVRWRCVRGSLPASALAAAEVSWQRSWRVYERGIARFISPSALLAGRMRQGGWSIACDIVRNAVTLGEDKVGLGDGFCVVGRLSTEKGVDVALEAARRAGVRMTVAGEGPFGGQLQAAYPEVEFLGRLDGGGVSALLARSRAAVIPSRCIENAPMSVLEAMASGTPLVASAIGGIPEQVTDDVDGLLVPPGDVDRLAAALLRLARDDSACSRLGRSARRTAATRFSPATHLEGLLATFQAAGARA